MTAMGTDETEHFQLYYKLLFPCIVNKCHIKLVEPPERSPNPCAMGDKTGKRSIPPYKCGGLVCDETGCWNPWKSAGKRISHCGAGTACSSQWFSATLGSSDADSSHCSAPWFGAEDPTPCLNVNSPRTKPAAAVVSSRTPTRLPSIRT